LNEFAGPVTCVAPRKNGVAISAGGVTQHDRIVRPSILRYNGACRPLFPVAIFSVSGGIGRDVSEQTARDQARRTTSLARSVIWSGKTSVSRLFAAETTFVPGLYSRNISVFVRDINKLLCRFCVLRRTAIMLLFSHNGAGFLIEQS
jgi:hypothetical protein